MPDFHSLGIGVITISDSRSAEQDPSGDFLATQIVDVGHRLLVRDWVADDLYQLRALFSAWIAKPDIEVIISTGGTGFTGRDSTPEAVLPLFDKTIEGFGELFRLQSFDAIGSATIQSRAVAGLANATLIFCLPGSKNACETGWHGIIKNQLNSQQKPCNFVDLIARFKES